MAACLFAGKTGAQEGRITGRARQRGFSSKQAKNESGHHKTYTDLPKGQIMIQRFASNRLKTEKAKKRGGRSKRRPAALRPRPYRQHHTPHMLQRSITISCSVAQIMAQMPLMNMRSVFVISGSVSVKKAESTPQPTGKTLHNAGQHRPMHGRPAHNAYPRPTTLSIASFHVAPDCCHAFKSSPHSIPQVAPAAFSAWYPEFVRRDTGK